MKAMTKTMRWALVTFVTGSVLLPAVRPATAATRISSLAGSWKWSLAGSCTVSARNREACAQFLTMGLHVYDLKTTALSYRGVDHLFVDSSGHYTEHGSATFSGKSPGAPQLKECNPTIMEQQLFQKSCHVTWTGQGHVAEGGTFQNDFYSDSGRLVYHGKPTTYYEDYKGIGDSLIPVVAGVYNGHRYLSLVGFAQFIPGITIQLTVRRA